MNHRRPTLELSEARDQGLLNIGQAAAASGVSAKMIRHYESIGLLPAADRTFSNYRLYSPAAVHTLRFVGRARSLGFSLPEIEELLALWQDRRRKSADVHRVAMAHVEELDRRIAELVAMRRTVANLASHCHGDERPQCPILEDLAATDGGRAPAAGSPAGRQPRQAMPTQISADADAPPPPASLATPRGTSG
jgi:MerR family transcriptional regulator, copper efflux regulator